MIVIRNSIYKCIKIYVELQQTLKIWFNEQWIIKIFEDHLFSEWKLLV